VTYGLIAAVAWGLSTVAAAGAARQLGTYYAVLISQVLGLAGLGALAVVRHPLLAPGARPLAGLAAAGVLGLLGWVCYYRALETGPVGLVSALGACYGGVTALLAVTVLGERIGVTGDAGVVLATAGVALAAARTNPKPATVGPDAATPAAGMHPKPVAAASDAATPAAGTVSPPLRQPAMTALAAPGAPAPWTRDRDPDLERTDVLGTWLPEAGPPEAGPPEADRAARRRARRSASPHSGPPQAGGPHPRPRQTGLQRAGASWRAMQPASRPADRPPSRARRLRARRPRSRRSGTAHSDMPQNKAPQAGVRRKLLARPGATMALASALIYGAGAFLLGHYSVREGWLAATLVTYATSVLALAAALPFAGRRRAPWPGARSLTWAVAAGVTEVIALLAFARGGQAGQVAVTAAVSSLSPALVLAAGYLVFRERLSARQLFGATCIMAGLVLLGLT